MKRVALLVVLFGMLALAAQVATTQDVKAPITAKEVPAAAPIRFNPAPQAIAGARSDTLSIAVSKDGKRIASVGGSNGPASGFVSVIESQSKKELLSLQLNRPYTTVGISPDGKLVAFAAQSGDLKVLEVESGKTVFSKKLDGAVKLAFSPDGESLATVTLGKTVQTWDVSTGEEQTKFVGATVPLTSVAFSADGRKLAVSGGEQQRVVVKDGIGSTASSTAAVFVWDVVTQRLLTKLEPETSELQSSIAFSPDCKLVAGVSYKTNQVRVWDLAASKVKHDLATQQFVFDLSFSPDGRAIAVATGDGTIQLWDSTSGEQIVSLTGHVGGCRCVSFTDGGKKLVSGGAARSLKIWDVADKKEIVTLRQSERPEDMPVPLAMAASGDGSLVALATEDKGVILRDGHSGEVKATLTGHEDAVTCVAFSPDGKTLASGSSDKTIKLWNPATGKNTVTLTGHTNWVYALAFSHDGKTLASGAYDKTIKLWDVESGKETGTIEAHRGSVRAVAFSPDDKRIASGGSDRFVKLWTIANRELKFAAKAHEGTVRAVAFSQDGKTLASGGEDGFVKFWNPENGKEQVAAKKEHNEEVVTIAFAGSRTVLSGGSDGMIRQWDAETGISMDTLQGHAGGVSGLAVEANGTNFISTGADKVIKRFRQDSFGPVRLFAGHTGVVQCVSFSPDGQRFVSCGNWPEGDKTLRIWNLQQGAEVLKIDLPAQSAMALYSPNGKYIASSSGDFNVYLWDAKTGEKLRAFKGHKSGVGGLAFNADGSKILSSSPDKTVRVWEVATGRELQKFTGHTEMIRRAVFHPDGKHALSAGRDGFVRMWELETGKEVKQFKSPGKWAECLAVSKDGKFLALGDKPSVVFDIESGKKVSEFTGNTFGATDLTFTDDAKRVISCGYDGTARLWDRETGKELFVFRSHREFLWMATFSPDGKWILTGGGGYSEGNGKYNKGTDHTIRLWKMPDEKAVAEFSADN